jgi:hypothetical protein
MSHTGVPSTPFPSSSPPFPLPFEVQKQIDLVEGEIKKAKGIIEGGINLSVEDKIYWKDELKRLGEKERLLRNEKNILLQQGIQSSAAGGK